MSQKYVQLKIEEREQIMVLVHQGKSLRVIAKMIGRHHTTISRELRRNYRPKSYWARIAQCVSETRKQKAARRKRLKNETIRTYVNEKLILGWSPEQIAGRLSRDHPLDVISYEAIYQYVYHEARELVICLARGHRKRRSRILMKPSRITSIPNRITIAQRPEEVNERRVFGHWEADLMVSKASKAALNVLVERMSRYSKLTKLADHTAAGTGKTVVRRLRRERRHSRLSITYDNGFENRNHEIVNQILKTKSYFCNPYHSWEKGTVENTAGLVRRFIPKRSDFAKIPTAYIKRIEDLLNNRPRKCLKYRTPKEVYSELSGALPG